MCFSCDKDFIYAASTTGDFLCIQVRPTNTLWERPFTLSATSGEVADREDHFQRVFWRRVLARGSSPGRRPSWWWRRLDHCKISPCPCESVLDAHRRCNVQMFSGAGEGLVDDRRVYVSGCVNALSLNTDATQLLVGTSQGYMYTVALPHMVATLHSENPPTAVRHS